MIGDRCERANPTPWEVWCEGRDGLGGTSIIKTGAGEDIEFLDSVLELWPHE